VRPENLIGDLERLHSELSTINSVDARERRALRDLIKDVEELLEAGADQPEHRVKLYDHLAKTLTRLEASHPRVTLAMERALESLAFLGV
jgi:Domain of unknown function (DUF4404)